MKDEKLLIIVKEARRLFEEENQFYLVKEACVNNFPEGCCGVASSFLGKYLIQMGYSNVLRVIGERSKDEQCSYHMWLTMDDIIIDITSDQCPDGLDQVYIGKHSSFHDTYTINQISAPPSIAKHEVESYEMFKSLMNKILT